MKLKENSLIITILLFPFILLLSVLKLNNFLKGDFYNYLIFGMIIVFLFTFIISLFYVLEKIVNSKNKKCGILVIYFSIFYLPIYYVKYVSKSEKYLGYLLSVASVILSVVLFFTLNSYVNNYVVTKYMNNFVLKSTYIFEDKNSMYRITVDNNYVCSYELEGYILSCDNNLDDSFLGMYSYQDDSFSEGELDDIVSFHFEEIIDYIEENGYTANIEYIDDLVKISYNDMVVLVKEKIFSSTHEEHCLIVIKEVRDYSDNIKDFINFVETIEFIG